MANDPKQEFRDYNEKAEISGSKCRQVGQEQEMRILNLGAGVQSTAVFLMAREKLIEPIDYAIFADTQEEPKAVYEHLAWLNSLTGKPGVPIIIMRTAGRIGDDLLRGENTTGQRIASIPAFTSPGEPNDEYKAALAGCKKEKRKIGKLRRQCTKEYKTQVLDQVIRRDILKLKPRQRIPKGTMIQQLFGISLDEKHRAVRIAERVNATGWAKAEFPLLDLKMTRSDCQEWLKSRVPHETPRSACVFCPFKSAEEWLKTKQDPEAWARAVEVDAGLRVPGAIAQRGTNQPIYVHRQAIPLPLVDLEMAARHERLKNRRPLFDLMECGEGMCGV